MIGGEKIGEQVGVADRSQRLSFYGQGVGNCNTILTLEAPAAILGRSLNKMHFVSYHPLKEKLRNRSVSDREALPYLMIFAALTALVGALPLVEGFNDWDLVSGLLSVAFAVGGVVYAYRSNGGKEGFDLIQKYVVLGWIVAVRCLLVFIPLAIVAYIAGEFLGLVTDQSGFFDVLLIAILELVFYQRIGRHIRDTRTTNSEQGVDPNA